MKTIAQIKSERNKTPRFNEPKGTHIYSGIGNFLREKREEARLTQKEVGKAIGVVHQTVMFWEQGKLLPGSESLFRLSVFYGFSLDELTPLFLAVTETKES